MYDYEDNYQQMNFLCKYFQSGFARGAKCYYTASESTPYHTLKLFNNCGIDAVKYTSSGMLEILSANDVYLGKGYFEPENTLNACLKLVQECLKQGFKHVYFAGDMTWASKDISVLDRLFQYEKKVNPVVEDLKIAAVCAYNKNFFSPDIVKEAAKLHPYKVIDNCKIVKNTAYVKENASVRRQIGDIIKSGLFGS